MQVLVTGAAGYIGTNLTNHLQARGHTVVKIDKLYDVPAERIKFHSDDKADAIVHLAAMPGIQNCERNKIMAVNDNVVSAEHVFRLGYEFNIPVVFTSSQAAKEPNNTYGLLKNVCEQLAIGMNVNVLRLTNVYGGERFLKTKTTVIANFINAIYPTPVFITGTGEQTRDFIHVDEVCRAIELCLDKKNVFVDIGTGVPRRIIDLAYLLQRRNIVYEDRGKMGVESSIADVEPAKNILGFEAEDKLLDYLKNYV